MATPSSSSLRLKSSSTSSTSEFIHFKATMRLPIPPVFSSNGQHLLDGPNGDGGMDGVREVLAGWVMRYLPPLHAVVLSFNPNPTFLHPSALFNSTASPFDSDNTYIKNPLASPPPTPNAGGAETTTAEEKERIENGELIRLKTLPMVDGSGFTLADVEWEGLGWKPTVGMKLVGTPTLSTSSHVSLLLHNLFNASIPSSHIPSDTWEFDPSFPVPSSVLERRTKGVSVSTGDIQDLQAKARKSKREALGIEGDDEEDSEASDEEKEEEAGVDQEEEIYAEEGWWVHKTTREPLGGKQGKISFTLVALSTSNSLLSCTGSLLSDPFTPTALASLHNPSASETSSNLALLQAQAVRSGHAQRREEEESEEGDSDESSQSDGEGEEESEVDRDDDDGVGTGVPRHEGVGSKFEDPTKSDSDSADSDSSSSSSSVSDSSRSPSPAAPRPKKSSKKVGKVDVDTVKKGKTKSEKKGKPPVVEEEIVAPVVKSGKKEKKRKGDEAVVEKGERKTKKAKKA